MIGRLSATDGATGHSRPRLLLATFSQPPFRTPILFAAAASALSLLFDIHAALPLLCGNAGGHRPLTTIAASWRFLIATNPPSTILQLWLIMLAAMMTPLIAAPMAYVRASSLVARRWRAVAIFLSGYFGVWTLAAVPVLAIAFALRLLAGGVAAAALAACGIALLWSACPYQQAARNRGHRLRRIGLFGVQAVCDSFLFGARLGAWCLLSCWAWMLVPLFASRAHLLAMLAVTTILMAERLQGPGVPHWRIPLIPPAVLIRLPWRTQMARRKA